MSLDPNTIRITNRQRSNSDEPDEHFIASVKRQLIHPIVLRMAPDETGNSTPTLVVGYRRLAALKKLNTSELIENIHFRFIENMTDNEAEIAELEENVKRSDLSWRDHVNAFGQIHEKYKRMYSDWTIEKTGEALSLSRAPTYTILMVYRNINSPALRDATNINQAFSILQLAASRRAASIVHDIINVGNQIFNSEETQNVNNTNGNSHNSDNSYIDPVSNSIGTIHNNNPTNLSVTDPSVLDSQKNLQYSEANSNPIRLANFIEWANEYVGPKFTLIHCDFPYDVRYDSYAHSRTSYDVEYNPMGFWPLVDTLCNVSEKLASYQSHMMFWFSMNFYCELKAKLESAGWFVHNHPLIWFKSDNAGIIPETDGTWPRRTYETALLCSRGKRPLVKPLANIYAAPTPTNPIHPSQKHEPMLEHFFSMLIDETTDVLDPTCGSGSAIRVAEKLGARSVLGLDSDPRYVEAANSATITARNMRRISQ